MLRTHTCGELTLKDCGIKVTLAGWLQRSRDLGGMTFIDLRDRYGITQLVFNMETNSALCEKARTLGREYVLQVEGVVSERSNKNKNIPTGDIEILVEQITVLNEAKTPPFTIEDNTDGGEELRMKYRYLDLRRNCVRKNLELRHQLSILIRNYMNDKKFLKAISWVVLAWSCICLMVTTETADSEVGNLLSMIAIALSYIGLLVLDHHNNKGDKSGLAIFTSIFKVINLPIVAVVWYYITTWIYDNIFVVEYTSSVLYNDVLDIESLFSVISFSLTALVLSFVVNIACKNRDKVLYYGSLVFGFIWAFVGLFYSGVNVVDTYDYFKGAASNFVSSVEILSVFSGIAFILVSCFGFT